MPRKTRQKEDTWVSAHDIFDGIFALLIIRGYKVIDTDYHTPDNYYAYDAACEAVGKKVEEICYQEDSGLFCDFIIRRDLHGTSGTARDQIRSWLSWGGVHVRIGGGRGYFFNFNPDYAEDILQRQIEATGLSRETYEELTKIFVDIYHP